jgi:hypothetical protein
VEDIDRNGGGPQAVEYPPWHWLTKLGLFLAIIGLVFVAVAYFAMSASLPEPQVLGESGYVLNSEAIRIARNKLVLRTIINGAGQTMMSAGFFMWLAGRVIDAFRHPQVY